MRLGLLVICSVTLLFVAIGAYLLVFSSTGEERTEQRVSDELFDMASKCQQYYHTSADSGGGGGSFATLHDLGQISVPESTKVGRYAISAYDSDMVELQGTAQLNTSASLRLTMRIGPTSAHITNKRHLSTRNAKM